jgi:type II secretory pathway pseudopilin PulG
MKRTLTLLSQNSIRPAGVCQSAQAIKTRLGFSLVEVVISLSIVSFALIAILGLLPVGLNALKESATQTTTSLLLPQIRQILVGEEHAPKAFANPYYFDVSSKYLGQNPSSESYFRVEMKLGKPTDVPTDTNLLVAVAFISWPTDEIGEVPTDQNGDPVNSQIFSFYVTPMTGKGWQILDPTFKPKIEL